MTTQHGAHGHAAREAQRVRTAFTLIEVLVTIATIALLVGLLAGTIGGTRKLVWNTKCLAHLRELSTVTTLYATDYKCLPVWGTTGPVPMLGVPGSLWRCHADREKAAWTKGSSYAYLGSLYMGEGADFTRPHTLRPWMALRAYERNPTLPLMRDFMPWHGHRNTAFFNGAQGRWKE